MKPSPRAPTTASDQIDLNPVSLFKCLAEDTRLGILLLLVSEGELCVCELTAALQESQPKISRHLALLKQQHLLLDRRDGLWIYYRLNPELPDWIHQTLQLALNNNPSHIADSLKRLNTMGNRPERQTACCKK